MGSGEYRRYAAECLRIAAKVRGLKTKATLLAMVALGCIWPSLLKRTLSVRSENNIGRASTQGLSEVRPNILTSGKLREGAFQMFLPVLDSSKNVAF